MDGRPKEQTTSGWHIEITNIDLEEVARPKTVPRTLYSLPRRTVYHVVNHDRLLHTQPMVVYDVQYMSYTAQRTPCTTYTVYVMHVVQTRIKHIQCASYALHNDDYYTLNIWWCMSYTVYCTMYNTYPTLYNVQRISYALHHDDYYTLNLWCCMSYTVYCTMYNIYPFFNLDFNRPGTCITLSSLAGVELSRHV